MRSILIVGLLGLTACGSGTSPFITAPDTTTPTDTADGGFQFANENGLPPGTADVTPSAGVFRSEPTSTQGGEEGDGFATDFTYDSVTDSFVVDNLAFDGGNGYQRDTVVGTLNGAAVYRSDAVFIDTFPDPDSEINQFDHRLIYRTNAEGTTRLAIVRTGAYIPYGFGGFIYERDGGVIMPTTGQALYSGEYSGIRDFDNGTGLEYITGDIQIAIDFDDFNGGDGVVGAVTNRRIFNINGTDITDSILAALSDQAGGGIVISNIPAIGWVVGPGVLNANGEMVGQVFYNEVVDGAVSPAGTGTYYGLLSGDNAETLTGILVVTGPDPRNDDTTVRETGGWLLDRGQ